MGDNVFMRMVAEDEADRLRRKNARMKLALNKITLLIPEEKMIPLDRAFALVREMGSIAREALK